MSKPNIDVEKVATQLRSMQQDLKALEELLRHLTDVLTEEEAQLSPEAKAGLKRLRDKTVGAKVELLLPKETTAENPKNHNRASNAIKPARAKKA